MGVNTLQDNDSTHTYHGNFRKRMRIKEGFTANVFAPKEVQLREIRPVNTLAKR